MDSATPPSLHVLAEMFRAARLPRAQWTHLSHLRVGAWHVHHFGPTEALVRLRHGIRALNVSNGVANTPTDGYHETITAAYVTLIGEFLAAADPGLTLERKVEEMLAGPLAERTRAAALLVEGDLDVARGARGVGRAGPGAAAAGLTNPYTIRTSATPYPSPLAPPPFHPLSPVRGGEG